MEILENTGKWRGAERLKELYATFLPSGIRLGSAGVQFLSTIFIARQLDADGSALFFFWSALLVTAAPMASYGLEQLVLRDMPRLDGAGPNQMDHYLRGVRGISLAFSVLIGISMVLYGVLSDGWSTWLLVLPVGICALSTTLINGEILKGLSRPVSGVLCGHFIPVTLFFLILAGVFYLGGDLNSEAILVIWIACFVTATFLVKFSGRSELSGSHLRKPEPGTFGRLFRDASPIFG